MNQEIKEQDKHMHTVVSLNTLLADYHIYYQNLRNFHWNILGKNFFDLHNKFESLYKSARLKIDEIAERILTLRYHPVSSFQDYLEISSIEEAKKILKDEEMVDAVIENQSIILNQMNEVVKNAEKVDDEGTIDLIGGYIRELEKERWMLRAWSKSKNEKLKEIIV